MPSAHEPSIESDANAERLRSLPGAQKSPTPRFETLDMLRGIAALFVINVHAYWTNDAAHVWHKGYLSVGLFFALSGFVIAHAYGNRLTTGLTTGRFMLTRLVRLYPLYMVGTLIGAAVWFLLEVRAGNAPDTLRLGLSLAWQTLFLPVPPAQSVHSHLFYPLNGPAWSMAYLLTVTLVFALIIRALRPPVLAAIIVTSAMWLFVVVAREGTLSLPRGWGSPQDGIPRTVFPFFMGVALYRLHSRIPAPVVSGWLIAVAFGVWIVIGRNFDWRFDVLSVAIVVPLLIWFSANARAGPVARRIGMWAGAVSYPIYILHVPMRELYYRTVARLFGNPFPENQVLAAVGYAVMLIVVAWLATRFFDEPVRRWLGKRLSLGWSLKRAA